MPDFGLTEALSAALKASKGVEVMRPAEVKLAARAAQEAPAAAAPVAPSVQTPSVDPAPGAVRAPQLNPSQPPADMPAPVAAADPTQAADAQPAPQDVAAAAGDAAPATPPDPLQPPPVDPAEPSPGVGTVAPANRVAPPPEPPVAPLTPVQEQAQRFVQANLKDFPADKLNMSHMPNVDVMSSPDGLKASILQVADDNKAAIDEARRGTVTKEQLIGMAQDLAANSDVVQQVLSREFGENAQRPEVLLAARMVEQHQAGQLYALSDAVANGSATDEEILRFVQQAQLFERYQAQLMGAKAEFGRSGQALQIPVGLDPAVSSHVAELIRQNNPDMQAVAKAIRLAGTPQGIATITQGSLAYRALVKAPFNMLQRIFINGILAGPPTWLKIFLGNNLNLGLNTFDLFAAGIGRGMAGLAARAGAWPTAAEGATISDAVAHFHGVISGGADALRVAGRVLKTGESMDGVLRSKEDFGTATTSGLLPELKETYFGSIVKGVDTAVDMPGRVIGSIDDFTKTLGYRGYLTMMTLKEVRARIVAGTLRPGDAESMMLDMLKNPSEEMQQAGEAWAHRMTFQSPWPEGGAGEAFQKVLTKAPALRFIFPFMKTATNIFKQSLIDRTPLGLFSARIQADLAAGGAARDLAVSRIATGTAIGGMLAWMAVHDRITGDAPKDPKARQIWEADGRTPYSIRVTDPITGKDTWRSITWFEPIATVAGVVADAAQVFSYIHHSDDVDTMMPQEQKLQDAISHVMASLIQNTGNKTFMQGAAQFAEMYNDPQRAFAMWGDQMGASMVPFSGALRFARNEQDPYLRQAFTLIDKIKDELPTFGLVHGSKTLPARLDVFGEPRKIVSGNAILGPMNPLPPSEVHDEDGVVKELQGVMEQTRSVPITMPSKQLAIGGAATGLQDGQGMRLTPSEYNDYVRMARQEPVFNGRTFRQELARTIASPIYRESTPAERYDLLKHVQIAADKAGREALWANNLEFRQRMMDWQAEKNRLKFGQ